MLRVRSSAGAQATETRLETRLWRLAMAGICVFTASPPELAGAKAEPQETVCSGPARMFCRAICNKAAIAAPGRESGVVLGSHDCSPPAAFFMLSSGSQAPSALDAASAASWAARHRK